jgi:hypothetical protein
MSDPPLTDELRQLSEAAFRAAEHCVCEDELCAAYRELRASAEALNGHHGWASQADLSTQLPTLHGLSTIAALERAYGEDGSNRDTRARVTQALNDLAGWATGIRLAYEMLDER